MRFPMSVFKSLHAGLPAVVLLAGAAWHGTVSAHEIFYTGRAQGINGTITIGDLKKSLLVADNPMSCFGEPKEETVLTVSNPKPLFVQSKTVSTYTLGRDNVAAANAAQQDLIFEVPELKITATALNSFAEARCNEAGRITTTGGSDVGGLTINGEGGKATGEPNQVIEIPGVAKITINEQLKFGREFRATALRIQLFDPSTPINGNIAFSYSKARVHSCEPL